MKIWRENRKWIEFYPAFDKRSDTPDEDYGIHGVEMAFYYGNSREGIIQFKIYTNWHLPHVHEEFDKNWMDNDTPFLFKPMPVDLGYHSPHAMYNDQPCMECDIMDGKTCFYDGSSLNAEPVFNTLVRRGGDAMWELLAGEWAARFGDKDD